LGEIEKEKLKQEPDVTRSIGHVTFRVLVGFRGAGRGGRDAAGCGFHGNDGWK